MIKGYVRYCDRCGVELTKANNTCGFELCDKCNEALEQQVAIKNDIRDNRVKNELNRVKDELEPTTKNNSSELEKNSKKLEKGTAKNNLGVDEVTALAEWVEKLTKASEDAYNKGYEAGMKAQEPRKGHWLRRPHVYGVTYCSVCDFELKIDNTNYCPNCGCKMEDV